MNLFFKITSEFHEQNYSEITSIGVAVIFIQVIAGADRVQRRRWRLPKADLELIRQELNQKPIRQEPILSFGLDQLLVIAIHNL